MSVVEQQAEELCIDTSRRGEGGWQEGNALVIRMMMMMMMMMMMTFITQRGESQGKTKKERKTTKSKGRGLEEGG